MLLIISSNMCQWKSRQNRSCRFEMNENKKNCKKSYAFSEKLKLQTDTSIELISSYRRFNSQIIITGAS